MSLRDLKKNLPNIGGSTRRSAVGGELVVTHANLWGGKCIFLNHKNLNDISPYYIDTLGPGPFDLTKPLAIPPTSLSSLDELIN
jgi:hypothetical protein